MAAPRGTKPPNMGKGRKKGVANKATADVRAAIAEIAEANAPKISGWLARIARRSPERAMDLYLRMLEYHIPKLTRTEIVKPTSNSGRVIDSSKLTAEEREQMRQIILRQMQQPEAVLLEQQQPNMLEPVGLGEAQVVERGEVDGSTSGFSE
jgi:hypothetical protein